MKRILFVDDDKPVLDAFRGLLRDRWQMVFVDSASRALTELEQGQFDVLVTDMRMPLMDGAELLKIVAQRWPHTIRIVLSGYSKEEQAPALTTVAHQYLSKPCTPEQLENVIDRCRELHEMLNEPRLRTLVGTIKSLPKMPRVYKRLLEVMADPEATTHDVARVISDDPAVAAKVLQIVNSSFFRLAKRIHRIDQAVTHLGFVAIRAITMSAEVFSAWRADKNLGAEFAPESLQLRAQQIAGLARSRASAALADEALTVGLLHNIGYWVLVQECPEQLCRAVTRARGLRVSQHEAERQVLGASYAEIGAYLLGIWGLPQPIVDAVAFQHGVSRAAEQPNDLRAVLIGALAATHDEASAPLLEAGNGRETINRKLLPARD